MFNRSEIMRRAWDMQSPCRRFGTRRPFDRDDFAFYLACAWREAKAAQMTPAARRAEAIKQELALLSYKSARVDIETWRRSLELELAGLAA